MVQQVGKKIRAIRESKGLTQANMAEELGITTSAYSKIERNSVNIPLNRLFQISEILEVKLAMFFENDISYLSQSEFNIATKNDIMSLEVLLKNISKQLEKLTDGHLKKKPLKIKK